MLLRDANTVFVVLNDALSNSLETHFERDLLGACDCLPLWRSFPEKARRLMDTQQSAQSLAAHHAAAAHGAAKTNAGARTCVVRRCAGCSETKRPLRVSELS
eukprot:6127478-Pleurochrysis_carterae.AAC.1